MVNSREKVFGSIHEYDPLSFKEKVLEKEEKELLEEDKLEKLFLKNICGEIMEEVLDLGSDCVVILPRDYKILKANRKGKKQKSLNRKRNERGFLE
jgi:hypothetical protein